MRRWRGHLKINPGKDGQPPRQKRAQEQSHIKADRTHLWQGGGRTKSILWNWSLKFSNRVEHWLSNAARNWAPIWLMPCFFAFSTPFSAHRLSQEAHKPDYKGWCRRYFCNRWVYKEKFFQDCLFHWWHWQVCNQKHAHAELDPFRGLIQPDTQGFVPWGADTSICTDLACPLSCDNINSRPGVNTVDSVTSNAVQSWQILYAENTHDFMFFRKHTGNSGMNAIALTSVG